MKGKLVKVNSLADAMQEGRERAERREEEQNGINRKLERLNKSIASVQGLPGRRQEQE